MAAAGGGGGGVLKVLGQIIKAGLNDGVKEFAAGLAGRQTTAQEHGFSIMAGNSRIINARNRGDPRALAEAMADFGAGEPAGAGAPAVLETPPRVSAAAGAPAVLATPTRGSAAAAGFGFATPPRGYAAAAAAAPAVLATPTRGSASASGFAIPQRVFGELRIMGPPPPRGKAAGSGGGQGWAYNYHSQQREIERYEGIMREFATPQEKKNLIESVGYPLILKDGIPDISTYIGRLFFEDRDIQYELDKIFARAVLDRISSRGRSGHRKGSRSRSRSRSRSGHIEGRKSGGTGKSYGGGLKGVNKRTNRTRRRNK